MSNKTTKPLSIVLGAAFATTLAASNIANASEAGTNPFAMTNLESGYQVAMDGKCGSGMKKDNMEGKCGEDHKKMSGGKCGGSTNKAKKKEGKCGEGKCGGSMKKSKMEGKCGGSKSKKMEAKCGEGKCGGKK